MGETTLKQQTAKGIFWGGFSNVAQQFLSIVFSIYIARILTASDYGLVGMLAVFFGIASVIINSGFSIALINKQNVSHKDYNAVFWFTCFVGLFLYIFLFFCAPLIAKFFKYPELVDLSRFLFISFFFNGIAIVPQTILQKQLAAKKLALIDTTATIISGCIGVILAINGYAYWAIAALSVSFITIASLLKFIIASWRPTLSFDFSPLKHMISFSLKLFLTGIFTQINTNLLSVILGKFYNKDMVGYYSQGQKWNGMGLSIIGGMFNYMTQPVLAQIAENKDRQIIVLRKMIRFGAFISFPLMLGLAFVGKEFVIITIGEKWVPCVIFLQLFCIWGSVGFLSTLYINLIYTTGKSNLYMYGTIITGLLQLVAVVALFPFGIYPMIIAYIFIYFIGLGIWQYYISKLFYLRLKDVMKDIMPYLGITLICFGITWLVVSRIQNIYILLALKIFISAGLYIFVLKISNSVIFKESVGFLIQGVRQKLKKKWN